MDIMDDNDEVQVKVLVEHELQHFLSSRITHHETQYTHQSIYAKKKYNIEDSDKDLFWSLYNNVIQEGGFVSICERPRPSGYTTIRGDFDIKIPEQRADEFLTGTHLYQKQEVVQLVEMYMDMLKKHVRNLNPTQLMCCVMEKRAPSVSDGYIKSGFHIEFPFLLCSRDEQRAFLFPKLQEIYTSSEFFTRYNEFPQSIFDTKAVTSNPWMIYGSKKGIDKESYHLSYILTHDLSECSLANMMEVHHIYNNENEIVEVKDDTEWVGYLPQIMSTVEQRKKHYMRELMSCDYSITKKGLPVLQPIEKDNENVVPKTPSESLRELKLLMPLLSPLRATEYKSWYEIGCVLFNLGEGSIDALELFISFSKRTESNNFSEANCIARWNKMKRTEYGLGTIIYYVKQDNPEAYQALKQDRCRKSLMQSIQKNGQLTSYACAEALYHKFKNEYVYTGNGKDGWFKFENHRWNQIAEGIDLRKQIPTLREPINEEIKRIRERINEIDNIRRDKEEANENADDESKQSKEQDKKRGMLMKEKNKLEDTPFKDKVLKECKDLFLDQKFMDKIDENANLMGFTNGVLDIEHMVFREGRPTDYITLSAEYDYREVGENEEEMRQIDDYLQRVFVNQDIRNYFLDHSCLILKGGNMAKKVVVWSGVGDNSKSVLVTLMRKTLGKYFYEFPTSLLVGKRTQSASASPEVAKSKGTRFAVIQEPSEKEEFNIGTLKELSGNDTLYARPLFREPTPFLPQFKLTVICNKLPRIPSDDQATWNRIRVMDFESRFAEESDCPKTFEEQLKAKKFPIDRSFTFSQKMIQAFISKLFQRYKVLNKRGFVMNEPSQVTEATKMYRVKNDVYMNFLNDKIRNDPESYLTVSDMYGAFKDWHKTTYTNHCVASRNEFKDYLEKCYKARFSVNRVLGIRYSTEEDDELLIVLDKQRNRD